MGDNKENTVKNVEGTHCPEHCVIGLEECAECGACDFCSDGVVIKEEELPLHWQRFIEKSKMPP
ncbi:MAG: hypothetical protein RIG61_07520 [Deltaproteobacteria bacterium]